MSSHYSFNKFDDQKPKETLCLEKFNVQVNNLRPHKCPICDGSGFKIYHTNGVTLPEISALGTTQKCNSCGGKGIVWG